MDQGTLYRLFDAAGHLLYIGETGRGWPQRMREHLRDKSWFHEIARVELQHFPSKADAVLAEAAAIQAEQPRHNHMHNGKGATGARSRVDCRCDSSETYGRNEWVVEARQGGYARQARLWLVPELSCDPVVDDVWDESGEDQLEYWVSYLNRHHRDDVVNDRVPISWFIAGDKGIFEAAPLASKHYRHRDFLDHFYWPHCSTMCHEDVSVDFFRLPVVMDRWPAMYEALGWRPSPLQPFCPLGSILRSRFH
jgi:hypothetical protein